MADVIMQLTQLQMLFHILEITCHFQSQHCERLWFNYFTPTQTTSQQEYSDLTPFDRQPSTHYTCNTAQSFSRGTQLCALSSSTIPKISWHLLVSENFVYSSADGTKPALVIIQLWFNYSTVAFFKALCMYFSREAMKQNVHVIVTFTPPSLSVHGDDHNSLPIFRCSSRRSSHLTHTSQPNNSSIHGLEHFTSDSSQHTAFSVTTAR